MRKERQAEKLQRRDDRRVKRNEPADELPLEPAPVELGEGAPPPNPPSAEAAVPMPESRAATK